MPNLREDNAFTLPNLDNAFTLEELKDAYLSAYAVAAESDFGSSEYDFAEAEMTAIEIELDAMGYSRLEVRTMLREIENQYH